MKASAWFWLTWRASAVLGLSMAAAWNTQQGWVTLLGNLAYLIMVRVDAVGQGRRLAAQEASALGCGAIAVVAASVITSHLRPIVFPFNWLISLGLGAALHFAAQNLLGFPGPMALPEAETVAEYRAMLSEMQDIAARSQRAARQLGLSSAVARRLNGIASVVVSLAARYRERELDYGGAAATLTILQQFDKLLVHYVKLKSGDQFLDADARCQEIAETEDRTLPMLWAALANLGQQLDAGEVVDKRVIEGTLESMLRSLNLIGAPGEAGAAGALEE